MTTSKQDALVWIDLEMSGLDPERCTILEIAALVTNADLEVLAEGPDLAIRHPEAVLEGMDGWNREHHGRSGLSDRVRASDVDMQEAERRTLAFLREHAAPGISPLCGNSVHNDRRFLELYMPELATFLHYRNLDVSTVKELVRRWYGPAFVPKKTNAHRALDDIRESVAELRHYRRLCFLPAPEA